MNSITFDARVEEDGQIVLWDVPAKKGDQVEVTVRLPERGGPASAPVRSLVGTVTRFDRPTFPVAEGDWVAFR